MRLSNDQNTWLKKQEPTMVQAFMRQGDPEARELFNLATGTTTYAPILNGIFLGHDQYDSYDAALKDAKAYKKKLGKETLPDVPAELLINHSKTLDQAFDLNMRLSVSFLLGAVFGQDEPSRAFEDTVLDDLEGISRDVKELNFRQFYRAPDSERYSSVSEYCMDRGYLGWLIQVEKPVLQEEGWVSWGNYSAKWFYAETFDAAWAKALRWADKKNKAEIPA